MLNLSEPRQPARSLGSLIVDPVRIAHRFPHLVLAVLIVVAVLVIITGYRGSQANLWGPPWGKVLGQDCRDVLRAAQEIEKGIDPYRHAVAFGRSPNLSEFMSWEIAPYPYPPVVAVLARPLLRFDERIVIGGWVGFNLALLLLTALLVCGLFSLIRGLGGAMRVVLLMLIFYGYAPAQIDLKLAQFDIAILFLLVLTFFLYRKKMLAAALPLALAIAIKPIIAPLLLFFLWKRERRLAAHVVAIVGLLTIWSFSVIGWSRLPGYLEVNRLWSGGAMLAYPFNQSVQGFALRALTNNIYIRPLWVMPRLAILLPLAAGLAALALWFAVVTGRKGHLQMHTGIEYGLSLTTLMIVSPLVDDIHLVWVLMPLSALLLAAIDQLDRNRDFLFLAATFLLALYLGHPLIHQAIYAGANSLLERGELVAQSKLLYTSAYLYGLIALQVLLVAFLRSRRYRFPAA